MAESSIQSDPTAAVDPIPSAPRAAYAQLAAALGHSGMTVQRYYLLHVLGAIFPLAAGLVMYGWRAALAMIAVLVSAAGAIFVWRRIGLRGGQLRYAHVLWLALLLAMMLPATLASRFVLDASAHWPILPLAGVMLAIFCWLLGGLGAGRIHPVVTTYLVIVVLYGGINPMTPRQVLQRNEVGRGDLMDVGRAPPALTAQDAWTKRPIVPDHSATAEVPASQFLSEYTTGRVSPDRVWLSLEGLLRDRLPPLEDLILGATPGPIGTGSAIAIIIGGLLLLYRGLIDFRIPLITVVVAMVALLVLPVPVVITDHPEWRWLAGHVRGIGWSMGVTFVNYEILASPLLFTAFFLATSPSTRPLTRRGRVIYAMLIGMLAAVFQLYVSVAFGPYLALMTASLLTPTLDKWLRPRALV
ncbi:MAG TPA: RnfABCDGE type electron transport complex subunit D [Tepidisphaeraceae bacterium]|nr:RnfABCDGE type electron transport complex subunit D [Tepidisphaeraceae bacterium]